MSGPILTNFVEFLFPLDVRNRPKTMYKNGMSLFDGVGDAFPVIITLTMAQTLAVGFEDRSSPRLRRKAYRGRNGS